MAPRKNPLDEALRVVAEREFRPPLDVHKNLVIDPQMDAVLRTLTEDPTMHMRYSDAMRYLMDLGVKALLASRQVPA